VLYRGMTDWFRIKGSPSNSEEIDQLTQAIDEHSSEQKKIIDIFNKAMNNFATERSLETCLEALNASMQIANIRDKLVKSYEYYARLLEREVIRLNRLQTKD
jgi:hypothetical protein